MLVEADGDGSIETDEDRGKEDDGENKDEEDEEEDSDFVVGDLDGLDAPSSKPIASDDEEDDDNEDGDAPVRVDSVASTFLVGVVNCALLVGRSDGGAPNTN